MPSIVARAIPKQLGVCTGRNDGHCPSAVDADGQTGLVFSCPVPICPVHQHHIHIFCSEACFIRTHASAASINQLHTQPAQANTTTAAHTSIVPALTGHPHHHHHAAHQPSTAAKPAAARAPTRVGKYQLGKTLGQGTFGKSVTYNTTQMIAA